MLHLASDFSDHAIAQPCFLDVSVGAVAAASDPARARHARPVAMITRRRLRPGCYAEFDAALQRFVAFATLYPGHTDMRIGWCIEGARREIAIVNRFAHAAARSFFTSEPEYRIWLHQLKTLTTDCDPAEPPVSAARENSSRAPSLAPSRFFAWKAFAFAFSAILGFEFLLPRLAARALPAWPAPERAAGLQVLAILITACAIASGLLWSQGARTSAAQGESS